MENNIIKNVEYEQKTNHYFELPVDVLTCNTDCTYDMLFCNEFSAKNNFEWKLTKNWFIATEQQWNVLRFFYVELVRFFFHIGFVCLMRKSFTVEF